MTQPMKTPQQRELANAARDLLILALDELMTLGRINPDLLDELNASINKLATSSDISRDAAMQMLVGD